MKKVFRKSSVFVLMFAMLLQVFVVGAGSMKVFAAEPVNDGVAGSDVTVTNPLLMDQVITTDNHKQTFDTVGGWTRTTAGGIELWRNGAAIESTSSRILGNDKWTPLNFPWTSVRKAITAGEPYQVLAIRGENSAVKTANYPVVAGQVISTSTFLMSGTNVSGNRPGYKVTLFSDSGAVLAQKDHPGAISIIALATDFEVKIPSGVNSVYLQVEVLKGDGNFGTLLVAPVTIRNGAFLTIEKETGDRDPEAIERNPDIGQAQTNGAPFDGVPRTGDVVTNTITVTNNGQQINRGAVVHDEIPEGYEFVPGSGKILVDGEDVSVHGKFVTNGNKITINVGGVALRGNDYGLGGSSYLPTKNKAIISYKLRVKYTSDGSPNSLVKESAAHQASVEFGSVWPTVFKDTVRTNYAEVTTMKYGSNVKPVLTVPAESISVVNGSSQADFQGKLRENVQGSDPENEVQSIALEISYVVKNAAGVNVEDFTSASPGVYKVDYTVKDLDGSVDNKSRELNITPKVPAKTGVVDKNKLTDDEKKAVADAIRTANSNLTDATTITIGDDGSALLNYGGDASYSISGVELVSEISDQPVINEARAGDTEVTGKGIAGAEVTVTKPGGSMETARVGDDVNWAVAVQPLKAGDVVKVIQSEPGKVASAEVSITIPEAAVVDKPIAGDPHRGGKVSSVASKTGKTVSVSPKTGDESSLMVGIATMLLLASASAITLKMVRIRRKD